MTCSSTPRIEYIYVVRCANCGLFFNDSGEAYGIAGAWITDIDGVKYLKQGIKGNEFNECMCCNPNPVVCKFKEVSND